MVGVRIALKHDFDLRSAQNHLQFQSGSEVADGTHFSLVTPERAS